MESKRTRETEQKHADEGIPAGQIEKFGFPLVSVEWVDSFQLAAGWHWLEDLPEHGLSRCHSVGWLIKEDENQIFVAETISEVEDGHQVAGVLVVPVCSIVEKKVLTAFSSSACSVSE